MTWQQGGSGILEAGIGILIFLAMVLIVGKAPALAAWWANRRDERHWRRVKTVTCRTCNGYGCPDCLGEHGQDWGIL